MSHRETEEYKGYTIALIPDDDHGDPREEIDHAATMVCWHRRYRLGDKHDYATPADFQAYLESLPQRFILGATFEPAYLALPLYLYDHSGITMSTRRTGQYADMWDAGQVGWIYLTAEKIQQEWGDAPDARDRARQCLVAEVEEYDQHLTGDVWGYVITDPDGDDSESCWGFFGHDYAMQEARSAVDYLATVRDEDKTELTLELVADYQGE